MSGSDMFPLTEKHCLDAAILGLTLKTIHTDRDKIMEQGMRGVQLAMQFRGSSYIMKLVYR